MDGSKWLHNCRIKLANYACNVVWSGTFSSSTGGVSMQWKWGAAVYTSFTTNYNQLNVKAGHQHACGMSNGDHAGTPEGTNPNTGQPGAST